MRKGIQKRGREYGNKAMNERKDWWRKKDRTYWCQTDSSNQTQGLRGSKGPLPGKKRSNVGQCNVSSMETLFCCLNTACLF